MREPGVTVEKRGCSRMYNALIIYGIFQKMWSFCLNALANITVSRKRVRNLLETVVKKWWQ